MSVFESIRIALRALGSYPLRSSLTILGIVVGIGAVVAMVAVGRGAQVRVAEQIRSLGANLLMVQPATASRGGARLESGSGHTLTESDARAIQAEIRGVEAAAPSVRGALQIVYGNRNWRTTVNGTVPEYFSIREWPVGSGRALAASDIETSAKVALIGSTVAHSLFGGADPVGWEIRIARVPFKVVGVLKTKGPSGSGRDQDNVVFVPISTAKVRVLSGTHRIHRDAVNYILLKVEKQGQMEQVIQDVRRTLRFRHRLDENSGDDFRIWDPVAAMSAEEETIQTFSILVGAIASISLIVGGISIMNIMLVSVTERVREIGIRLAVGARPNDIRRQFLLEAITLCVFGGISGMGIGIAVAWTISAIAGWPVFIGIEVPLLALFAAMATGIFFGYYPASRAAKLSPMEALRFE